MKKTSKWIVAGIILAMAVSVVSVCALDETQAEAQSVSATAVTYDVGSYGSSGYLVEWNTDVTFPTARYKRTIYRDAVHYAENVTSHNGGFAWWCVMCVSDGEQATDWVCIDDAMATFTEYYDTYGTRGYTDKLRLQGCMGSMSAGITIYNAQWCPDAEWFY